ncbi:[Fe-Fe] hydrogenase large subunit C-terminal domain-containing protein [Desulfosporosinus sp. OT]|uniref:[Fe-Fe] hydrogenase large subunit C-terminal domain-containing protein n=1 Tax=Desulfosporosinus sp. OT TaxID=913865 RepID=UPI000223AFD6|nr:[Fe-Fe] hydrogenase large subunit C-terminal domain-containing protein [Desulfosporosinus sp. OT]EGW36125.1 4Fe-4S binding domain protein [Desulfosporosinus sp. OT]
MQTYDDIFQQLVRAAYQGNLNDAIERIRQSGKANEEKLELLLHPENLPPVVHLKQDCSSSSVPSSCQVACLFSAIQKDAKGQVTVSAETCVGCELCIESCKSGHLVDRKDFIPLFEELSSGKNPVYAMIAPAFIGQFSADVTPGKLRTAFKKIGFHGMMEVALFADILTLKEAFEFDRAIKKDQDFLLTSCCCPMWVAMIRKTYSTLVPHMPPSVSPMVAGGRVIKHLHPGAKTVFIGPCLAKKAEAKEADIRDAVDYVLTFQEITEIFDAAKISLPTLKEDEREHSSRAGRIYARSGGVSTAVSDTLARLRPNRTIPLRSERANGIVACKKMLKEILNGEIKANFLEGMGCTGGCVGGPKSLVPVDLATKYVNDYGNEAPYETPADNPSVLKLLDLLGYKTLDSFLDAPESMFTRKF